MNKILSLMLICLFFTRIFAQKDPIEMAIESYDDKKINEIIVYCKLLEKNKAEYLKLIEQKLKEHEAKPKSCLNSMIHYGKALISGTLAVGSIGTARQVFKDGSNWGGKIPLGVLLASCGGILSLITIDQIRKGWSKCDENRMKYYKSLAIAKDLNNLDLPQN